MLERVMLVLIGGRSGVPAIAGVLQFLDQVDRIKFLLCREEQYLHFQKNIEKVIKQERENLVCDNETDVISVDPNKFDEVYIAVQKLCQGVEELKYVNLSTVPQSMAFSVYSYILEKYKDVLVFTVNTDQSQIIPLVFGKQAIPFNKRLSVENYIALCGFNIFKKVINFENNLENTAKYIVDCIQVSSKIISVIRSKAGGGDSIKAPRGFSIDEKDFIKLGILINELEQFFIELEKFSIIHNLQKQNNLIKFRIETKENYAFLAGDWLEVFVYSSAKQCSFDSVEMGVEIDNYRGEIDVFCLNSANAMICECKTGGKLDADDLSVISSKAEKLGGNYCVKLFITSESDVGEEFLNKAKNNRVVVVSGNELTRMNDILAKEMQFPTYPRR
ncbi:Card1-like endonuclease domain-containing protein [Nostoc sp. DSM 114167]|jgi:hypothetical protein|uniref:Card1-like endonuclease domain-containing protein n=1 Tax=Nostoc sp. DSM 114167 TaxID=3439050 RepID=UPI004045ACE0